MESSEPGFRPWLDLVLVAILAGFALQAYLLNRAGMVGLFNDDSFYAAGARLLVDGHGYRFPGTDGSPMFPPYPRFPIGFPAILAAAAWGIGDWNQAVGAWEALVGCCTAGFLIVSYALLTRTWGVARLPAGLAVAIVGFHPITVKYAAAVMSDLPFAFLALGSLALIEWTRRKGGAGPACLAGLSVAGLILVRYAGVAALVAGALVTWQSGRRREATWLIGAAGIGLLPWIAWVISHRAFDYGRQYDLAAGGRGPIAAATEAAGWLLTQSLSGLVLPWPLLKNIENPAMPAASDSLPLIILGACVGIALLAGCLPSFREERRRLPALYAFFTLILIVIWTGAFKDLGWDLQVRMLLPIAPILLGFALDQAFSGVLALPVPRRVLVAAGVAVLVGVEAWAGAGIIKGQWKLSASHETDLKAILAATAFIARIPPEVQLAAPYPAQAYFYVGRPFLPVIVSRQGIDDARLAGARVLLTQPRLSASGADLMLALIRDLAREIPPRARVLYVAAPHLAVVHLAPVTSGPKRVHERAQEP